MGADMGSDRERLLNDLLTLEALLTSEARRYFDNSATSFFRFEAEEVLESRPARVRDGACEVAVLEHVLDPQVLDRDEGVALNVASSDLVRVVLALAWSRRNES